MTAPITIAILAGGAATRLGGRDKGLQPLLGRPLIAHVMEAVAAMDATRVLIVANRHADDYAAFAETIRDSTEGFRGPLAGVAAALAVCASPWLATLPVDCPQPPRDFPARLLAAAQAASLPAAVVHDGERRQPLFALYQRELASAAAAALEHGHGVWPWQDSVGARELDFADRHAHFRNLNTAQDFAAYATEHAVR